MHLKLIFGTNCYDINGVKHIEYKGDIYKDGKKVDEVHFRDAGRGYAGHPVAMLGTSGKKYVYFKVGLELRFLGERGERITYHRVFGTAVLDKLSRIDSMMIREPSKTIKVKPIMQDNRLVAVKYQGYKYTAATKGGYYV